MDPGIIWILLLPNFDVTYQLACFNICLCALNYMLAKIRRERPILLDIESYFIRHDA